jgi:hypothetical protein
MTTENVQKETIEALRNWLEENRADYMQASEILTNPKRVRGFVKSIAAKMEGVIRFDPYKHPPEAAVAEVAKMQERIGGVLEDIDFLDEYEEKKKRFTDAIRAIARKEPKGTPNEHSDKPEAL